MTSAKPRGQTPHIAKQHLSDATILKDSETVVKQRIKAAIDAEANLICAVQGVREGMTRKFAPETLQEAIAHSAAAYRVDPVALLIRYTELMLQCRASFVKAGAL